MAKWWLLTVNFPETGPNYLQIYADDESAAITGARSFLHSGGVIGPDENPYIAIRDSSPSHFTNPVITSGGIKEAGEFFGATPSSAAPPPTTGGGAAGSNTGGGFIPENEPQAQFLRGLARRGVDTRTIAGRAQADQASDVFRSFLFQNLLQGFSVPGQQPEWISKLGFTPGDPNAFEQFSANRDIGGARRGAAEALRGLLTGNMAGVDLKALQALRGPEQFGQPSKEQAGELGELAKVALQSRISPLALDLLRLPSGNDVRNQFLAQGQGGSFLDYFRNQYPLMGLGI